MIKKIVKLLAGVLILCLLLTACNRTSENVSNQKTVITILKQGPALPPDVNINNNQWADVYKKAFPDIELKWNIAPPEAYMQKRNIIMASGDIPDIIFQPDIYKWSEQGLIMDVTKLFDEKMPAIKAFLTEDQVNLGMYNDKRWAIPFPSTVVQPIGTYIREDWLKNLNLKIPETIDELTIVLKMFANNDPDKNGKKDTFGFGGIKSLGYMYGLFLPFGVHQDLWEYVDGKLVPDIVSPQMKEALSYTAKLYADGILDKEISTMSQNQLIEKAAQGRYGIISIHSGTIASSINPALEKTGGKFVNLPPIKGLENKRSMFRVVNTGGQYAISAKSKNADKIAELFNWLCETDTSLPYKNINADKVYSGEVGKHAKIVNNTIVPLLKTYVAPEYQKDEYRYSYRISFGIDYLLNEDEQIAMAEENFKVGQQSQEMITDLKLCRKFGRQNPRTVIGPIETQYRDNLLAKFDELKMKIVLGEVPVSEFDNWVNYFYKNKGAEIIEEATKYNPQKIK